MIVKLAKMNEHSFNDIINEYGSDNDDSDCFELQDNSTNNDPNAPIKNGCASTQPIYTECTRMIVDQGSLDIVNDYFLSNEREVV